MGRLEVFRGCGRHPPGVRQALGTGECNAKLFQSQFTVRALKHPEVKALGTGSYGQTYYNEANKILLSVSPQKGWWHLDISEAFHMAFLLVFSTLQLFS